VLLLAFGCAQTRIAPIDDSELEEDERHLWKQSAELQRRLDRSGEIFVDAELQGYLEEVAGRLFRDEFAAAGMEPRVRVLAAVDMNAFALANGSLYLHTAILARMDNEAQLATLLGHELSHVVQRHSLRSFRDVKNKTAFMSAAAVVLSPAPGGSLAALLLQVGTVSSVFGYSRELEREADVLGFERLVAAGYDGTEAPRIFEQLRDYQEELDEQGVERDDAPYFFSTHPRLEERIESYRRLIDESYGKSDRVASGTRNEAVFAKRVERATVQQARLEVDAGRPRSADVTVRRVLARSPRNATAWLALGEALEASEAPDQARDAYQKAVAFDPGLAEAHRALGLSLFRAWRRSSGSESPASAIGHLERYLALEPRAPDRAHLESYLRAMRGAASRRGGRSGVS
jgi:predicted Zn-dependent protease